MDLTQGSEFIDKDIPTVKKTASYMLEKLSRDKENIKIEFLEIKTTMCEIKTYRMGLRADRPL